MKRDRRHRSPQNLYTPQTCGRQHGNSTGRIPCCTIQRRLELLYLCIVCELLCARDQRSLCTTAYQSTTNRHVKSKCDRSFASTPVPLRAACLTVPSSPLRH